VLVEPQPPDLRVGSPPLYHSTLGSRAMKEKQEGRSTVRRAASASPRQSRHNYQGLVTCCLSLASFSLPTVRRAASASPRRAVVSASTSRMLSTWKQAIQTRICTANAACQLEKSRSTRLFHPDEYYFSMKITTRVKLPVTSHVNRVVIFVANRIGDPRNPRNRISQKYSPRLYSSSYSTSRRSSRLSRRR